MTNLLEKKLLRYHFFVLLISFLFSPLCSQEITSSLMIKSNPKNEAYWWLEKNNYGKSITDTEFEYIIELTQSKTTYRINISHAYQDINYISNENNNSI